MSPDKGLIDRRTLDFLLYDWLATDALARRETFDHDRSTIDAVLDLAEELALKELVPHFSLSDRSEPTLDDQGGVRIPDQVVTALGNICKTGIASAGFSTEFGGLGLPATACTAALGILQSAVIATPSFLMLTAANARLITSFGTSAQIDAFARPQIEGRWFGTMCLSETQAGSSLADIATRAVADGEDALGCRYRLRGTKMWISGGDHQAGENILHLVLAKTPQVEGHPEEGTRGISLFMVPKVLPDGTRNDVEVTGLNHKLGYRGLPNCVLSFGGGRFGTGNKPGALGWRVGEVGQGLPQMFQMMNEARMNVGLGSVMTGYRAYRLALAYAAERIQGRKLGEKAGPPVAIIQHPDVKRMLLAQKAYSEGGLALVLYAAKLVDEGSSAATPAARVEASRLLDLLTPVVKVWPSEWGQVTNDLAIQVFGGAGYTRDVPVEQLFRDQRLNQIHEGTTGIQALDLVGRKLLRDRGEAYGVLVRRVEGAVSKARGFPALVGLADRLESSWEAMNSAVSHLLDSGDSGLILANATPFLWAMGHAIVGWIWLEVATVAMSKTESGQVSSAQAAFASGKVRACRYFFEAELPKVVGWLTFSSSSDVAASMTAEQF